MSIIQPYSDDPGLKCAKKDLLGGWEVEIHGFEPHRKLIFSQPLITFWMKENVYGGVYGFFIRISEKKRFSGCQLNFYSTRIPQAGSWYHSKHIWLGFQTVPLSSAENACLWFSDCFLAIFFFSRIFFVVFRSFPRQLGTPQAGGKVGFQAPVTGLSRSGFPQRNKLLCTFFWLNFCRGNYFPIHFVFAFKIYH